MNRSIQAFAVLLVSLAGGMLAATWNSTLPLSRPVHHNAQTPSAREIHCSCNPDSLIRFEDGCARDKTTGELYGCGLGLGNNGAARKSVITHSANAAVESIISCANSLGKTAQGLGHQAWASRGKELAANLASLKTQLSQLELPADRSVEQDYSAAELAAAGLAPGNSGLEEYLPSVVQIPALFSAESVNTASKRVFAQLANVSRASDRQTRLWLVEAGLHRQWDAAEIAQQEQHLAGMLLQAEEENIQRWFENFPGSVTRPNRLLNPEVPSDDSSENSRRAILAAARVLESLSTLLHVTAENLARQAEQDVAELHKLKSGIEERR